MKNLIIYIDAQGYKKDKEVSNPDGFKKEITLSINIPENMTTQDFFNNMIKMIMENK